MRFECGETALLVNTEMPVSVLRHATEADRVQSWPDLNVGQQHPCVRMLGSSTGVWVVYQPEESLMSDPPAPGAAVHLGWDGTLLLVENLGGRHLVGATQEGLLLVTAGLPDPEDKAAWYEDPDATYLTPAGALRPVKSDRRVVGAYEDASGMHHLLYAGPPLTTNEYGGVSYSYPLVAADVSSGDTLDSIRLHARSESVDEQRASAALEAAHAPRPVDGARLPTIPWTMIKLSERDAHAATQAVVDEFRDPNAYWHTDDGTTSPLATGLTDARVEVISEWPNTRVEVSFVHPHYPDGWMRRILPVFDAAGRINPHLFASVHLMEDLDTRDLPHPTAARDSILTI